MELFEYIENFFKRNPLNLTKIYLIVANIILVVFAIWFSNAGLLPFKNFGDFAFFAILALILGLYRPSWTFAFFVGTLVLENINLAPKEISISLRPYQFFGFIAMIALLVQFLTKRLAFSLPKLHWYDALPIVFALAGFLSALGAVNKGASFKQALVALSFVALYFLVRIYVQSLEDLGRIAPFFLSSGLVVMIYAIWQNIRFLSGGNSFEVMPGRPNSTFTEADWLGIYLVFLLSIVLTIIYKVRNNNQDTKNKQISNFNNQNGKWFGVFEFGDWILFGACTLYLVILYVVLILTVSRSAWVGAAFVIVGFLKFVLYDGSWKFSNWQWKNAGLQLSLVLVSLGVASLVAMPLTSFQLASRASSTGGLQKITISCRGGLDYIVPQKISSVEELKNYECRHINLEDIEKEKEVGNIIMEVNRPDPNINIRSEIYKKSIAQIKLHPIFGLGWGGISSILGSDERGAGLNASNIFLEVWLGAGLLGFLSFVILLFFIFIKGAMIFFRQDAELKIVSAFVLLGWTAIVVPNLFNSGIFLGFIWGYLGAAVGLLSDKKSDVKIKSL